MKNRLVSKHILIKLVLATALVRAALAQGEVVTEEVLDIAAVWAGHPVGFNLLTHGERQFVAFYDADRKMTVASRGLGSAEWQMVRLPSEIKWDSHNYIAMTIDDSGRIHLAGNMHCVPLIYFRTREPLDIRTFERIPEMTGEDETRCTYPAFFRGINGELVFTYRQGGSGNGFRVYNVYDDEARQWKRLLDEPLVSGEGKMNAYPFGHGPVKGPDGLFHLVWIWRDTPDCATNHDISYARSRDLRQWTKSDGTPLALPITIETGEIVDPVQPGGGAINSNLRLGFDAQKRPVISYHKHDENGNTQVYNARLEDGEWRIYKMTDWDYRWDFSGGGSIGTEIRAGTVGVEPDGSLSQSYSHKKYGGGIWKLDPETLRPIGKITREPSRPPRLGKPESEFPGMTVRWRGDSGHAPGGGYYMLRWETLGPNRDRPRPEPWPEPSMLRVYKFKKAD